MHQHLIGDTADQHRHILSVIEACHRRVIVHGDAVHKAHVHIHDLKTLTVIAGTGDDL
ncbi:hypothetical protein D3C73_1476230 [compost metagenome]